jgi:hypothetical protein
MSSRRNLLGAVAAAAVVPAAVASPANADAELIRLATEHERLGRLSNADFPEVDDDEHPLAVAAEARRNRIRDQQDELIDGMLARPPSTLEGLQALASALAVWDLELIKPRPAQDDGVQMIAALVRGLLNMRGSA